MNEQPKKTDVLTDHTYDGIQEYDNPTPGWWNWLFIATIVFSVLYFFFTTISGGQMGPVASYERSLADEAKQIGKFGKLTPDAPTLLKFSRDAAGLKAGESIFRNNCVSCHGQKGEGLAGPNLTDDYYINVNKIEDIYAIVENGSLAKGMPPWRNQLKPSEMVLVSSYVASLRGKNVPGKGPEGELAPPWTDK